MTIDCGDGFSCGPGGRSHCWRGEFTDGLIVCWVDRLGSYKISNPHGVLKGAFDSICEAVEAYNRADPSDFVDPAADTPWTASKLKKGLPGSHRRFLGSLLAVRQTARGTWFATLDAGKQVQGFHHTEAGAQNAAEEAAWLKKKARA